MTPFICHNSHPYGNFIPFLPFATDPGVRRDYPNEIFITISNLFDWF